MIAYVNNQFIDENLATLGIGDMSIQRGFGIFDYFRTSNNQPLFLDEHLTRFFHSAKELRLNPLHTRDELKGIIKKMISHNNLASSGFRMILTGGYSPDNFTPVTPNFIVIQQPITLPSEEKFTKGLSILLHEYQRDVPYAKSINYLMSIYLLDKLNAENADDVLYHKNGNIFEFPRANVFIVTKEKVVVTPSLEILHGITRQKLLEVAVNHYRTEQRSITIEELKNAEEVFLTSTTKRILPVLKINQQAVGNGKPGPVTKHLLSLFTVFEETVLHELKQ